MYFRITEETSECAPKVVASVQQGRGQGKEGSLFCFHPFSIMTIALIAKTKYRIKSDLFKYSIRILKIDIEIS